MSSDLDLATGIPATGRQFRPGPVLPPWRGGSPGTSWPAPAPTGTASK